MILSPFYSEPTGALTNRRDDREAVKEGAGERPLLAVRLVVRIVPVPDGLRDDVREDLQLGRDAVPDAPLVEEVLRVELLPQLRGGPVPDLRHARLRRGRVHALDGLEDERPGDGVPDDKADDADIAEHEGDEVPEAVLAFLAEGFLVPAAAVPADAPALGYVRHVVQHHLRTISGIFSDRLSCRSLAFRSASHSFRGGNEEVSKAAGSGGVVFFFILEVRAPSSLDAAPPACNRSTEL